MVNEALAIVPLAFGFRVERAMRSKATWTIWHSIWPLSIIEENIATPNAANAFWTAIVLITNAAIKL
jgi:hypothetical protein